MKAEVFQEIIRQLEGLRFDGRLTYHFYNEPLLNPELEKLVSYASRRLPQARHVIYTNGDLLTAQRLASLVAAGVTSFVVTDHGGRALTEPVRRAARMPWPFRSHIRFRRFTSASALFNRGGLIAVANERRHSYCAYPAYELVIDVEGNVVLCCNDYYGTHTFGNIMAAPLLDIWDSPRMSLVRRRLLAGQFDLAICRACVGIGQPHSSQITMVD
jgi:MoaA/NifB/PqqE/SkfB family radical SAM enzyme